MMISSEYLHIIGTEVGNQPFNYIPELNYLITISPPLNRVEISEF